MSHTGMPDRNVEPDSTEKDAGPDWNLREEDLPEVELADPLQKAWETADLVAKAAEEGEDEEAPEFSTGLVLLAALAFFTVFAFTLYSRILDLGLLGWDSYPLVWSSACQGIGDVFAQFRTELMGGIYTDGTFYRPITSLSFAFNEAFSGLDARGYHLFDLAVLVTSAVMLVGLGRRMAVTPGILAGSVAGLVFLLHPVQLALLPVPPRRADALSLALLLACLMMQRDEEEGRPRSYPIAAALLAFAAAGAKETGALIALLVPVWQLARGQRWGYAALQSLPVFLGVAAFVGMRTLILGGLGGHGEFSLENLRLLPELIGPYTERVIGTGSHGFGPAARSASTWGAALATIAAAVVAYWKPGHGEGIVRQRQRGAWILLAIWTLAELAMASLAGRMHDWYALQLVAPFALFLGLLFATGARLLRDGRMGLVPLLLPLPVALSVMAPLGGQRTQQLHVWEQADELTQGILKTVLEAVDANPIEPEEAGAVIRVDGLIPVLPSPGLATVAILSDYSVDAYLAIVRPDRNLRVQLLGQGTVDGPELGELVVLLAPPSR